MALILSVLACGPAVVHAQGTALVPVSDPAYVDIDRLAELGALDSTVIGHRPYSRREFARIVHAASTRLDAGTRPGQASLTDNASVYADQLLQRLSARFGSDADEREGETPSFIPLESANLYLTHTDANRRGFPSAANKPTEATIDPLARRRLGTPAVKGTTTALELGQRADVTGWLALQAMERMEYRTPYDTTLRHYKGELLLLTGRARMRNVALTVGRQQLAWAQSANTGLFLSSDAPALDAISLTGDHPFVLPGFLRVLGATQGTLVFADLGQSVVRSHSKLVAYKVSVQPGSAVEFGGTFMNHFGGSGAPSASLGNRIVDLLPFIDVFRTHNYTDSTRTLDVESDKLLGVDGRVRIAPLAGLTIAGEVLIDDFDVHRIPKLFTGYGSQTLTLILPELGTPELSLAATVKHMGIITYTHGQLTNGITTRGRLLGDELGPDAKSFGAQLRWTPSPAVRFELEGRSAIYSNAEYAARYAGPNQTDYQVNKVSRTANELRDIALGTLILQTYDGIALTMRAGGERVRNADFLGGRRRDWVGEIGLRIAQ